MGRPKKSSSEVSKLQEKATLPKNRNAGADLVSKKANLSADKVNLHDENKNGTRKRVVFDPNIEIRFYEPTPVRRSRRLQNIAALPLHMEVDRLTQVMTATDSDDEDLQSNDAEASLRDENLEEQIQYLLGNFKKQQQMLNDLKSKRSEGGPSETSSTGEVTYKSLYFNSQMKLEGLVEENNLLLKKAEALVEEHGQLSKKLDHALGKIEVFEKCNHVSSNVLEKLKPVIMCPPTKGSGAGANSLSEAHTRR